MELFKLLGTIAVENSDANKAIDNTTDKAEGAKSKMSVAFSKIGSAAVKIGKTIAVGVAAGSAAVGKLGYDAMSAYADFEQLVGGVETLFKNSAGVVKEYANEAYKTAGMSANEYMETITGFSASLLQSLGGDTAKAAEYGNQAVIDMSDNANKMGTSMEAIQNAYSGFAKQNYTMLDNLKLGYGGTKEEMQRLLTDAEKLTGKKFDVSNFGDITEAIHAIQSEMGITGTTAKEASSTIQGSLASVKGAWQNLLTGLADPNQDLGILIDNMLNTLATAANNIIPRIQDLLPRLLGGIKTLLSKIIPMLPDLIISIFPNSSDFVGKLSPIFESLLNDVLQPLLDMIGDVFPIIMGLLNELLPPLISIVKSILPVITKLLKPIISLVAKLIQSILPPLVNIINQLIPFIGKIIDAVLPMVDSVLSVLIDLIAKLLPFLNQIIQFVLPLYLQYINTLIPIYMQVINGILPILINLIEQLMPVIMQIIQQLLPILVDLMGKILPIAIQIINAILPIVSQLLSQLIPILIQIIDAVLPIIILLLDILMPIIDAILPILQPILDLIMVLLVPLMDFINIVLPILVGLLNAVSWVISNVVKPIIVFLIDLLGNGLKIAIMAITEILKVVQSAFSTTWTTISNVWSGACDFFKGIWNGISNAFASVGDFFKNLFSGAWNGIKNVWNAVGGFFSNVWSGIKNTFSGVGNFFKDIFQGAYNGITGIFSKIGGFFKDVFGALGNIIKAPVNLVIRGLNFLIGGLNKISFDVPDWIPVIGGKKFGFNIGKIPELAKGGVLAKGQTGYLEGDGAEAVVPLENNTGWIKNIADKLHEFTIQKNQADNIIPGSQLSTIIKTEIGQRIGNLETMLASVIDVLKEFFPQLLDIFDVNMVLDDGTLVAKLTPKIDEELGEIYMLKRRGVL